MRKKGRNSKTKKYFVGFSVVFIGFVFGMVIGISATKKVVTPSENITRKVPDSEVLSKYDFNVPEDISEVDALVSEEISP